MTKPEEIERLDQMMAELQKPQEQMTERQRRILETSLELFAKRGYNGVSTSEIAAKADVAEATIFKHFKTKKGLFLSIVTPVLARMATPVLKRTLEKILDDEQPLEQSLSALFFDRVQLLDRNWPLVKVIVRESQYHPELWQILQDHFTNKVVKMIGGIVEAKQASGQLRRDLPSYTIIRALLSTVMGYVMLKHFLPDVMQREDDAAEIDRLVDILLNGIGGESTVRP